ncbi:hypothetical protein NP493_1334g01011 [Ridgeia piscesae]|nr:hypothetical protein NP493_1334g01011 [Ridgeia piscesae]
MFRHKTLPYAVHTFQRRCFGNAACHCIIAIRSGDDVIVIDSCGPDKTPASRIPQIEVQLYLNGDLTPGTIIEQYNGGYAYKVRLPTGTVIQVKRVGGVFLNTVIYLSTADYNQTEGLCGSADDDPRNDLFGGNMPTEWIKTWR